MAYRRKQGNPRSADLRPPPAGEETPPPSSIAAQAIRASSAHRDSSLSSAYGESAFSTAHGDPNRQMRAAPPEDAKTYEYTSIKNLSESKGFWGILAQKAKNILELENAAQQRENPNRNHPPTLDRPATTQSDHSPLSSEGYPKNGNPRLQKGLDKITSSLNYIGGKVGSTLEEGLSIVETRTANIIQETRKLNIRRKGSGSNTQTWVEDPSGQHSIPQLRMDLETQLKAARDVSNAMAAKAKLLMRELKTVKADLAFAKERCAQLEEENKILRESNGKGGHPEDDDLIRLQLETLLAEKGRLAHENSIYARENRFLREIVEYHQLTMQDVVYLDEGIEEVTEVYPTQSPTLSSQGTPTLPSPLSRPPSLNESAFHHASAPPASVPLSPSSFNPSNLSTLDSFGQGNPPIFPVPPVQIIEDKQGDPQKGST